VSILNLNDWSLGAISQVIVNNCWGFEVVVKNHHNKSRSSCIKMMQKNDIDDSDDDDNHDVNRGGLSSCYENSG